MRRTVGSASLSFLNTKGSVRPPRSRMTTTTLALAGLFFGEATVNALCGLVLGSDVTAKICAVDFDRAGECHVRCSAAIASRSLCAKDESRLVLAPRSRESWRALYPSRR